MSSLLSDELLRALVAVGEVDVLVGLPTLDHSETVAGAVRAAHVAFNRELARERTVLLNVDGGSKDGTPDIVRDASIIERETLLTSHSLRSRHRISAPYHGVPGKASALRTVFASADLLHAKAVVVLDPEVVSVSPESIAALVRPVLKGEADFVSPLYARHPRDGLLITQVVRPLFRATYGLRLSEPLAGEVACSERFATRCLELPDWDGDLLRAGVDLWLTAVAAASSFRVAEVRLGPRRLAPRARLGIAALVPQVLGALFGVLRLHEAFWTVKDGTVPVPLFGEDAPTPSPAGGLDPEGSAALFREGVAALEPLLARALRPGTLEALRSAAATPALRLSDELWAAVVLELAAAHRRAELSRDHLLQAAVPLYLGRVAAFAVESAGASPEVVDRRLEELCLQFERSKPALVALWTASPR